MNRNRIGTMNIHDDRFISIVFSHATCSHVFDDSNNLSYICYSEEGSVGKQQSLPWNPRVWINIADISNDINAFGVVHPISVSICTLLLFLKRIIDPIDRDQVTKIRVYRLFEQFLHEYSHPISISETRSIWNYFSKRLKQNIQNNDKWNRWGIFFFFFSFFLFPIWTESIEKFHFHEYHAKIERIWYPVMRNES